MFKTLLISVATKRCHPDATCPSTGTRCAIANPIGSTDKKLELLAGLIAHLPHQPPAAVSVLSFEVRLLTEQGLKPDLAHSRLSGGSRQLVESLASFAWPALPRLCPSPAQLAELSQFLHGFLLHHLGRIPNRRDQALAGSP